MIRFVLRVDILLGLPILLVAGHEARPARLRLPLRFEQVEAGRFEAREGPLRLRVEPGFSTVTIGGRSLNSPASVTTRLAGANQRARVEGVEPLPARANYLLGREPARWRTGVSLYSRTVTRDVYPGIDLVFHGDHGTLEYDFVIRPGARVQDVALDISGASGARIDTDGSLALQTRAGAIRWKKPEVFQWRGGRREAVPGAFHLRGRRVTFDIGPYDHSRDLTIDPTLTYATYLGGNDNDALRGLTVDGAGNFYVTGFTYSQNLPRTGGTFQPAYKGPAGGNDLGGDAFVAKYTSSGALSWVTYLGGKGEDCGSAIAVDSSFNLYITGFTTSTDFPVTAGALQSSFGGSGNGGTAGYFEAFGDAFVVKLSPTGTALVYATYLGGSADEQGTSIAVDDAGNAFVGGATLSSNFPTKSAYQSAFAGAGGSAGFFGSGSAPYLKFGDAFIAKLNPPGSGLIFSTYLGGELDDTVSSIAVDTSGNVYAGGSTMSTKFPMLNAFQATFGGAANSAAQPVISTGDGYVAKFDSAGKLVYSTYLGGSRDDGILGLAVDKVGSAYVTGFTSSSNFPVTASAPQKSLGGPSTVTGHRGFLWGDAFVARLTAAGGLAWSTYLGGNQDDAGMAIAVDTAGNAIVGGLSSSTNLPVSSDALQKNFGGDGPSSFSDPTGDGFLAKISADGTALQYLSYYGGNSSDAITSIAIDGKGNVISGGATTSSNLTMAGTPAQTSFGGQSATNSTETLGEAFVTVFSGIASAASLPSIDLVVNGASFLPGFTQGSWVTVKGSNLAGTTRLWTGADFNGPNLPVSLDNVSATINGKPAYVYYISPTQLNILSPADTQTGPVQVAASFAGRTSSVFTGTLVSYAPALFTFSPQDGKYAAAVRSDGQYLGPNTLYPGLTVPAKANDIVLFYGTGFGPTDPATNFSQTFSGAPATVNKVSATIGGLDAAVLFSGLVAPGEYQFNIVVPNLSAGEHKVVLTVNGVSSQASVYLAVQ